MVGVNNNHIVTFRDISEKDVVKVPKEDRQKQRHPKVLATETEERREAVRTFATTSDGKLCDKFQQQKRSAGKTMSAVKSSLLTALGAQLDALMNVHDIARQGGNADAIDLTKEMPCRSLTVKTPERKGPPS